MEAPPSRPNYFQKTLLPNTITLGLRQINFGGTQIFSPQQWQTTKAEWSVWGRRIVWCTLTSWYLVSLLSVSKIHVSDIFLVGFWSWEISFIMWGCRGWGWQAAGTWVSVSVKWWDSLPPSGDLEPANQYAPSKKPAGELKSLRAPKFEQKPTPFIPIELL